MRDAGTPMDVFDGAPAERAVSTRWLWLLILLVLISMLVAVAAFSPPGVWSASEIAVFVLTALLCTLVAISLGLTECREWLTRSEQSLRPIATQVRTIQDLQTQLCEAVHQGHRELNGLSLQEEGNRHVLENRAAGLAGGLQAVAADVAALGAALQSQGEATRAAVAALAGAQGQWTNDIQKLQAALEAVAGGVAEIAREQAALCGTVQENSQILTAMVGDIQQSRMTLQTGVETLSETGKQTLAALTTVAAVQTAVQETVRHTKEEVSGVGARQMAFQEAWQVREEAVRTALAALNAGQEQLAGALQQLHDSAEAVAGVVTESARQQAAAHSSLEEVLTVATQGVTAMQSHDRAMNAATATLVAGQGRLAGDVGRLHELTEKTAGAVSEVARQQAGACDAVQDGVGALTASAESIQQGQTTLQREIEKMAERTEQTTASLTALVAEQSTGRETTRRMIGEVANAAIAALALGHGRLTGETAPLPTLVPTVEGQGPLDVQPPAPLPAEASPARLPAAQAVTHGEQIRYEAGPDRDNLGFWANANDWAEWDLEVTQPGRFRVTAEIAALGASRFQVVLADRTLDGSAPNTGDYGRFQQVEVGTVELAASGKTRVVVRPIAEGWQPMNLRSLDLATLPA